MKITVDLGDLEKELIAGITTQFYAAFGQAAAQADSDANNEAANKLRKGLENWGKGYSFRKVSKDVYVLAISGKLAMMMEDGIEVGEISKMLMDGNRAKHNAAEGKDYVDVPFAQEGVAAAFHKDANSLASAFKRKTVNLSDLANGGVRKETRMVRRLQNAVIESKKDLKDDSPSFLTIRRVTSSSVWPKQKFDGAKTFEEAAKNFADNFTKIFESSL